MEARLGRKSDAGWPAARGVLMLVTAALRANVSHWRDSGPAPMLTE